MEALASATTWAQVERLYLLRRDLFRLPGIHLRASRQPHVTFGGNAGANDLRKTGIKIGGFCSNPDPGSG
jgi:hypothetical protein